MGGLEQIVKQSWQSGLLSSKIQIGSRKKWVHKVNKKDSVCQKIWVNEISHSKVWLKWKVTCLASRECELNSMLKKTTKVI